MFLRRRGVCRGHTHALTDTAPTELAVAYASPLAAQPQSDLAPCTFALDGLKRVRRSSSLQASRRQALEVRYRAAAGVGEEAHSRQSHWCPWSKPMNVETCGDVADLIVMAHAFVELRDGVVARHSTKNGLSYVT
eukprot:scaffold20136_cov70-Phaeocystis_antarctica.AAC.6